MKWVVWALLLVAQNAAFVMNSRARNGASLPYHAFSACCSNGIWYVSQFFLIDSVVTIIRKGTWAEAALVGVFYTTFTLIGALTMHWLALHHIEKKVKGF